MDYNRVSQNQKLSMSPSSVSFSFDDGAAAVPKVLIACQYRVVKAE